MIVVECSITVQRASRAVFRFLREPGAMASLQPFIAAIEHADVAPGGAAPADAARYRYRAIEVIPVLGGLLSLRNIVDVEQTNDEDGERWIESSLRVTGPRGMRRLTSLAGMQIMRLEPVANEQTRVVNRLEFHTYPRLFAGFIRKRAHEAHTALLGRLKESMEAEPGERCA